MPGSAFEDDHAVGLDRAAVVHGQSGASGLALTTLWVGAPRTLIGALIVGCGLVLATSAATAQQYQTTGVAQMVGLGQDVTYGFTMAVDGCKWCV